MTECTADIVLTKSYLDVDGDFCWILEPWTQKELTSVHEASQELTRRMDGSSSDKHWQSRQGVGGRARAQGRRDEHGHGGAQQCFEQANGLLCIARGKGETGSQGKNVCFLIINSSRSVLRFLYPSCPIYQVIPSVPIG